MKAEKPLSAERPFIAEKPAARRFLGERPAFSVAAIAVVMLTVTNIAAAAYLYSAMAQMSALGERLTALSDFEARIDRKLEVHNTGMHSQFDRLMSNMAAEIGSLKTLQPIAGFAAPALAGAPAAAGPAPVSPPAASAPAGRQTPSSYQRIESPDGRVYYRKQ